eukprot:6214581-Pleurochrysis_carterae.AAC.3
MATAAATLDGVIVGGTTTGYRAVGLGVQGRPLRSTPPSFGVYTYFFMVYEIFPAATVRDSGGELIDVCSLKYQQARPCARGDKEAWEVERERSGSTHAMQMQNGNPCLRAMNWGAQRQLRELCGFEGQPKR